MRYGMRVTYLQMWDRVEFEYNREIQDRSYECIMPIKYNNLVMVQPS